MAISEKALIANKKRNGRGWSHEDIELFKKECSNYTANEWCEILDRPTASLYRKAELLNIKMKSIYMKSKENLDWSNDQISFLKENSRKHTPQKIAYIMGIPLRQVVEKGLKYDLEFNTSAFKIDESNKSNYVDSTPTSKRLSTSLEKLTKKRDEVLKALNGRYNEELYSELNSLNTSINQLKQKK